MDGPGGTIHVVMDGQSGQSMNCLLVMKIKWGLDINTGAVERSEAARARHLCPRYSGGTEYDEGRPYISAIDGPGEPIITGDHLTRDSAISDEAALRSYCVGSTKYGVGIRSTLVLCRGYQICRGDTLYARTV